MKGIEISSGKRLSEIAKKVSISQTVFACGWD